MNYMKLYDIDVVNGKGTRCTLFVCGCEHHCKGCYNQSTWDKDAGIPYTTMVENYIIEMLNDERIRRRGLSISGGEPLEDYNLETVKQLCKRVKTETHGDIWLWTGFVYEDLTPEQKEILQYVDILIDGEYVEEQKDKQLLYRGSTNQRVIDVKETLKQGKVIIAYDKRGNISDGTTDIKTAGCADCK
jgi:anaerobic ribonucleoside-triphosphate reductase activating protein